MAKVYLISSTVRADVLEDQLGDNIDFKYIPCDTEDEIIEKCSDAEVLVTIYEPIGQRVMDSLKDLKYICVASIGFDGVDLDYAKKKGIPVSNNPSYCIEEVADHTLALIMDMMRNVSGFSRDVKENKSWDFNAFGNTMYRMSTRTIGLIGFGDIARLVANRVRGFGGRILVSDPFVDKELIESYGAEKVDQDQVFKEAHIISLHVPLNDHTKNLINDETIEKMEAKPYIVNCSRGKLIDQEALARGLESGKIRGAALDVLIEEYPDLKKEPLTELDNIIITPHVAFYSRQSYLERDTKAGGFVQSFVDGKTDDIPFLVK